MAGVYWVGSDRNLWVKDNKGVRKVPSVELMNLSNRGYDHIPNPNPTPAAAPTGGGYQSYSDGGGGYAPPPDPDAAVRGQLRGEIGAKGGEIDSIYGALFGDLDNLLRSRDAELEQEYGGQLKKATDQYTDAIPTIETSYAAIGADSSTDQSDAKTGAKEGFDETTATIGKNKKSDKAKLGQYGNETRAKFTVDRDNAKRNIGRAGETEDVGALRQLRNELENNIGSARVTRSTLGTDAGARGAITNLTKDGGRFEAAINALDSIIKSSMSGSVKEAAVKAVADSSGLDAAEKKKIEQTYGNVYAEQAAL